MGRPLSRAIFLGSLATAVVACNALTGVGDLSVEAPDAAPEASGSPSALVDAGKDVGVEDTGLGPIDATVVDGCSATSCEALPPDFQLVALGEEGATCPEGFDLPLDVVENPTVASGACACGCDLKQAPSCAVAAGGTITLSYGALGSGTCASGGQEVPTGCSTDGFLGPFIAYDRSYAAPRATLSGGSCTPKVAADSTKLTSTSVRLCQATRLPQCEGKTCPPALAGFETCIGTSGEVTCPSGWTKRHLVGTSASITCGAGCTCTVAGNCSTTGKLSYFTSTNCSGTAGLTYPVGGCQETDGSPTVFASHRYDPNPPTNARCQTGGASTPTATLAQPSTVCCR